MSALITWAKGEPAALLGAVASAVVLAIQAGTSDITWAALGPVVIGAVIRFFVTPATKANPPAPATPNESAAQ